MDDGEWYKSKTAKGKYDGEAKRFLEEIRIGMRIIVNNNKCKLVGNIKIIMQLRQHPAFAIRMKGAFFSPAFRRGVWDGYIRFITESGVFDSGMLPKVVSVMEGLIKEKGYKEDIIFEDERIPLKVRKIPKQLGEFKARDYQIEAVEVITDHNINGLYFPHGLIEAATNAGKTLISAMLHKTYDSKTLFLLNSKELFADAIKEIPKFIPGEVGIIASGYETEWNRFMIVMVQTANKRIDELRDKLAQYKVVLVDEADLGTSKSYLRVLNPCFNSYVRIGLTGSAMVDPRKKEKNEKLRATFGNVIYRIKNKELIDKGYSSDVLVYIWPGNDIPFKNADYNTEYEEGIIKSSKRNSRIIGRVRKDVKKDRLPILVITKLHSHVDKLYRRLKFKSEIVGHELFGLKIDWVHHKRIDRRKIVKRFEQGKIDILVGSYILKRGKNFPLMRSIIHAGGGDSMSGVIQILGRATRKHESKSHTVLHDFSDLGSYLKRHSKHRISTYKGERLKVIEYSDL